MFGLMRGIRGVFCWASERETHDGRQKPNWRYRDGAYYIGVQDIGAREPIQNQYF
jgi:hypothetical protein